MLLPLQGAIYIVHIPRALPWAIGFLPLRGVHPTPNTIRSTPLHKKSRPYCALHQKVIVHY